MSASWGGIHRCTQGLFVCCLGHIGTPLYIAHSSVTIVLGYFIWKALDNVPLIAGDLPIVRGLNLFFLGLSRRRFKLVVGGLNKKQKLIFRFEILKFKILKFFKFQILNFEIFKFKFDKNAAS